MISGRRPVSGQTAECKDPTSTTHGLKPQAQQQMEILACCMPPLGCTPWFFIHVFLPSGNRRLWGSGRPRAAGKPFKSMGLRPPYFCMVPRAMQTSKIDDLLLTKKTCITNAYYRLYRVLPTASRSEPTTTACVASTINQRPGKSSEAATLNKIASQTPVRRNINRGLTKPRS